ncbi:GNAT family N-acetyltransferase [Bremerella sp. JC770]|uniref:GNAT family N-acetyltransferase n=1 Tax=Bremerella sp. JC770 TaxID=3232137 RepID=UPI00345B23CB
MDVRPAGSQEYAALWQLFHDTVHHVNRSDYSPRQLAAWAPDEVDLSKWSQRMEAIQPFVVTIDETIVGFADVQPDGLIDMFFVHHAWQRRGIGSWLFREIHHRAESIQLHELHSHVSITACPFFQSQGFEIVTPQEVTINGVVLNNFLMRKMLSA